MPIESTPLIASDDHLAHDGLIELQGGREIPCWESPERAIAIRDALLATGDYVLEPPDAHGPDPISAVHELELIDLVEHVWTDAMAAGWDASRPLIPDTFLLRAYAGSMALESLPAGRHLRLGAYCFDTATPIVAGTADAARAAVDIALTAADRVLDGAPLAYGLCRPPGHHAGRNLIGGYCYFNNAAIVAESLVSRGASRVAILDVDFHHGNGTQQIFWQRDDVLYVSLHGDPGGIYPYYSGYASERGGGWRRGREPEPAARRPEPMATATWPRWPTASTPSPPSTPMRRSSSRSASTPTTPTRSATSRCRRTTTPGSAAGSRSSDTRSSRSRRAATRSMRSARTRSPSSGGLREGLADR